METMTLPKDLGDRTSIFFVRASHTERSFARRLDDFSVIKSRAIRDR